jgi:outer membrane protein
VRRAVLAFALVLAATAVARADTLEDALSRAYRANPNLNSGRAGVRAIDESVPQALSGLRPRVSGDARLGVEDRRNVANSIDVDNYDPATRKFTQATQAGRGTPRGAGLSVEQPLFDGFKTYNATRSAQSGVFAARERLRLLEQRVLLETVSAYMDVLRDTAALRLQDSNVDVLTEQLRQTRERFAYGVVTPTDIAQAQARLSAAQALRQSARAMLETSLGRYRQNVGVEPRKLSPAQGVDRLLPKSREEAEGVAALEHPVVLAALQDADTADLDIRVTEGDFMPQLSVVGSVFTQSDIDGRGNRAVGGALVGKLSVPIFDGGKTPSRVRQAKEIAGQKRLDADAARAEVMALVRANWSSWQAAKTIVTSAQTQIDAASRALYGVREEAKAGQRTTLDILNAQLELLNARLALLSAQRDRVVASYALLGAVGRLSAERLRLPVDSYDPTLHFDQIKDDWIGTTTPSGR